MKTMNDSDDGTGRPNPDDGRPPSAAAEEVPATVVSFDIDGTLELGDPPGPLTLSVVRQAQLLGYIVGSCSDRTLREQRELWRKAGLTVNFVVVKNGLSSVRDHYPTGRLVHIGDTGVDEQYARLGGFEYAFVGDLVGGSGLPGHLAWLIPLVESARNVAHDR
jgi:hypothetical protein